MTVWSNNDYGPSLVVNPVILVPAATTTSEILVVNKNPGITCIFKLEMMDSLGGK